MRDEPVLLDHVAEGPLGTEEIEFSTFSAWSWNTNICRTNLSTVQGLDFTPHSEAASADNLNGVLQHLQELKVQLCRDVDIEDSRPIGEGETFSVEKSRFKGIAVAVKHIKLDKATTESPQRSIQRRLQSVLREIMIMHHSPLAKHPNIVSLVGYGWQMRGGSPFPYLVVEFGVGGCLRQFLARKNTDLRTKLDFGSDIAAGLMALHQCSIVHGDLKLDNIIIFEAWEYAAGYVAKISDFGHSSIPTQGTVEQRKYYGTLIYNAPEVAQQRESPIKDEDLHKCDIWAYGLLIWEILIDGATYFQKNWYSRAGCNLSPESRSVPTTLDSTHSPTAMASQEMDESLWGTFDLAKLKNLAKRTVQRLKGAPHFEKSYLKPLFEKTLQIDPQQRISDLTRLPIFSLSRSKHTMPLQSRLTLYTGVFEHAFDVFRPDRERNVFWAHQKEILIELEKTADSKRSCRDRADLLLQIAFCYILGYGCERDHEQAAQYLLKAREADHLLMRLFGDQILDVVANSRSQTTASFTSSVAAFFRLQLSEIPATLRVINKKATEAITRNLSLESFRSWALSESSPDDYYVILDSTEQKLSCLELAILCRDEDLVSRLAPHMPLNAIGAWGETVLIQACRRTGSARIARILLAAGAKSHIATADGITAYHWLFALDERDDETMDCFFDGSSEEKQRLNQPSQKLERLHPQWPFEFGGTPLAVAVQTGCIEGVKALLRHGAYALQPAFTHDDVKPCWTAMHLAAKYLFPEILTLLVSVEHGGLATYAEFLDTWPIACAMSYMTPVERYGVHGSGYREKMLSCLDILKSTLGETSAEGISPLMQAISYNDQELVELILLRNPALASTRFVKPSQPQVYNYPIHLAAQITASQGRLDATDIVETICKSSPDSFNLTDSDGRYALHLAASGSSNIITQWLIQNGARIDTTDNSGRRALHYARHLPNLKALLTHGSQVNHTDKKGFASLHEIASLGPDDCLIELIQCGAQLDLKHPRLGTAVHCAVHSGSLARVSILLRFGSPVNEPDTHGVSPLSKAVKAGRADIAELLLSFGASTTQVDDTGSSPLLQSVWQGSLGLARLLLKHGAPANQPSHRGDTPLLLALRRKETGLVRLLLEYGASVDQGNEQGAVPLVAAVATRRFDLVRLLLDRGAPVDQLGLGKVSPLLAAVQSGCADIVRLLLGYGASRMEADLAGRTPLRAAVARREPRILEQLLSESQTGSGEESMRLLKETMARHDVDLMSRFIYHGAISESELASFVYESLTSSTDQCRRVIMRACRIRGQPAPILRCLDLQSLLHFVVEKGFFDVGDFVLHLGADPNGRDKHGALPLLKILRARSEHDESRTTNMLEFCKVLIRHGADVTATVDDGPSVLDLALASEDLPLLAVIFEATKARDPRTRLAADPKLVHRAYREQRAAFLAVLMLVNAMDLPTMLGTCGADMNAVIHFAKRRDREMLEWYFSQPYGMGSRSGRNFEREFIVVAARISNRILRMSDLEW